LPDPVKQFLSIGVFFQNKCKKYFAQWKIYLSLQSKTNTKTDIMKTRIERVKEESQKNIDFLMSKEGWEEVKNILSMAALDMSKKDRKQFFEVMRNEEEKKNFLIYLFATTSIEAAILQTK
jgi:hypothetical protein